MINMAYFRQPLPFRINRGISAFQVKDALRDNNIDFEVYLPSLGTDLQRPFVWTHHQNQQLILSVLKGIKLPMFSLVKFRNQKGGTLYEVIDGKQRLGALLGFVTNQFSLDIEGQEVFFYDLGEDCQRELLDYWIVADEAYEYYNQRIPDTEKVRWFNLINFAGTPQDQAHFEALEEAMKNIIV